jgi:hypothetical protein
MTAKRTISALLVLFCTAAMIQAQSKGTIVFVSLQDGVKIDPVTGEYPDMPYIYTLQDAGYEVVPFYNASLSTAGMETLDTLWNADLIVMGRSTPSTIYGDHKQAWNDIPTPIINLELWNCRSSRLNWFNTTNMVSLTGEGTVYNALIEAPEDSVFLGMDTSAPVPWAIGPIDLVGTADAGNGTVLAKMESDNTVLFVRFEPYIDFYDGAGEYPVGYRTVIGNGRDNSGTAPFHYYTFTTESEQVFLAEVAHLIALNGGGSAVKRHADASAPTTCELSQNYPNPFNPMTTIPFDLRVRSHVRLSLTDILGKEVKEIADGDYSAGHHEIVLDAARLAAGIYFYKIEAGRYSEAKKLAIVK